MCKNLFHKQIRMNFRPKNFIYRLPRSREQQNQFCNQQKSSSLMDFCEASSHTRTETCTPSQTAPSTRHVFARRHPENNSATTSGIHRPAEMAQTLHKKKSSACAARKHSCCGNGILAGQNRVWKATFHLDSPLPGGLAVHKRPGSTRLQ